MPNYTLELRVRSLARAHQAPVNCWKNSLPFGLGRARFAFVNLVNCLGLCSMKLVICDCSAIVPLCSTVSSPAKASTSLYRSVVFRHLISMESPRNWRTWREILSKSDFQRKRFRRLICCSVVTDQRMGRIVEISVRIRGNGWDRKWIC